MSELSDDSAVEIPSKSQLKRDSQKMQILGQQLVDMPEKNLQKFTLEESLLRAIYEARRLKSREARRRQIQCIGKLIRSADLDALEQTMDRLDHQSMTYRQQFANIEHWRQRIIDKGAPAIEALIEIYPNADRQQLRNLRRQASREQQQNRPPVASRKLFKYLRELAD